MKQTWLGFVLVASFIGVSLDLLSTNLALLLGFVEMNVTGNLPWLYYSLALGVTWILFKTHASPFHPRIQKVRTGIMALFIVWPYICYLRNVLVIGGLI